MYFATLTEVPILQGLIGNGMFSARTMDLLHSHVGRKIVIVMGKLAAGVIAGLGIYFSVIPFQS